MTMLHAMANFGRRRPLVRPVLMDDVAAARGSFAGEQEALTLAAKLRAEVSRTAVAVAVLREELAKDVLADLRKGRR